VLIRPKMSAFLMLAVLAGMGACAADSADQASPRTIQIASAATCGIRQPVQLDSLSGGNDRIIKIKPTALLDRAMTSPLTGWEAELRVAAIYHLDQPITALINASSYACRNVRGGEGDGPDRISRHAKGMAFDVSGFRLGGGQTIIVAEHWGKDTKAGRFLRAAHKAACRHFDTVLGPRYNRAHRDHFHVAMGSRSGFCR